MEPESPSPYSQVPATCPYPEPTPSSHHDSLQLPEDPLPMRIDSYSMLQSKIEIYKLCNVLTLSEDSSRYGN